MLGSKPRLLGFGASDSALRCTLTGGLAGTQIPPQPPPRLPPQDTNGDACIVEASAPGGKRQAVRGWRHIHAVLDAKQQLLAWRVLGQMLATAARLPQHEADPDGAVTALQRLATAAAAAAQAALYQAVASAPTAAGAAEAAAMDVDGAAAQQQPEAADAAALGGVAAAAAAAGAPAGMLSSAALDVQAALARPGFQQQFEARALLLLSRLLAGGDCAGTRAATAAEAEAAQQALLSDLLRWLRHATACQRVGSALQRWAAAGGGGRRVQRLDSGEEFVGVWQLEGGRGGAHAPPLVVVAGDAARLDGGAAAAAGLPPAAAVERGLSRAELERALQDL